MVPAGLVIGVGGLVFNVAVGRIAGVSAYGAIGTLLIAGTIGTYAAQGAQFELAASVSRAEGAWRARPWTMVRLIWPWLAVAAAGLAAAGPLAGFLHLSSPLPVILAIGLFVVTMIGALPTGVLVGTEWFVTIAAVGVTMTLARIGLGAGLAVVLPPVSAFLLASLLATAAGAATFVLAASICLRKARGPRRTLGADELALGPPRSTPPRSTPPSSTPPRSTPPRSTPASSTPASGSPASGASARGASARGASARGASARGASARGASARGASALQGGVLAVAIWVAISVPLLAARHLAASGSAGRFAAAQALALGILFVTAPITPAFYPSLARSRKASTALLGLACTAGFAVLATGGLVLLGPSVVRLFYGASFGSSPLLFAALGTSASVAACLTYALWACSALGRRRLVSLVIVVACPAEALLAMLWHPNLLALAIGPGLAVVGASGLVGTLGVALGGSSRVGRRRAQIPAGTLTPGSLMAAPLTGTRLTAGVLTPAPLTAAPLTAGTLTAPLAEGVLLVTVGIMAYNEQESVEAVIAGYLAQQSGVTQLAEIVVVASGCTDRTVERAQQAAGVSGRVRVMVQPTREGKLAAVRSFLAAAGTDVVVVSGADTVPAPDLLEAMGRRLAADDSVGMVGGRIVPVVPAIGSFAERLNEVLWGLHHQVALRSPKLGEIVALRRSYVSASDLHDEVGCDEVALEAAVTSSGGRLAYEPSAVVGNRGPRALGEYLSQRRRIRCQHLGACARLGYRPSTASTKLAAIAVLAHLRQRPQDIAAVIGAVAVEAVACGLAHRDHRRGLDYRTWAPALSARVAQVVSLGASEERL
jgi:biofilm PGA synthesis N-glycosyltransferase PgaC